MPELPEVETVCRGLAVVLEGRRLAKVDLRRPDLRIPFPPHFADRLTRRTVTRISRRAKYMCWHLDDGWVVICHLGMSGRMIIGKDDGAAPAKHDHVVLVTDQGDKVSFNDARRFGLMDMAAEDNLANHRFFKNLGPEPLTEAFDGKMLKAALKGRSSPIKPVLLDQTLVVGIGNIYASESLFRSGIHPARPAESLTAKDCAKLAQAIKEVLTEAIAAGGSSLKDHRQPSGELGYFQHAFAVYDREGEPCPGCTCRTGVRKLTQAGRSTYYCDKRQS